MLLELGNLQALGATDDAPRVTTMYFPDADETGLGGYTLAPGMAVRDFRDHVQAANDYNNGITHLPDHEILLAATQAWRTQGRGRPSWIKATADEVTVDGREAELERFLSEYFETPVGKPEDLEYTHWTKFGAPGSLGPFVPDLEALFTDVGRVLQAQMYGGGQVGIAGTMSAATSTTLTTNKTLVTNAWDGFRVYAYDSTANQIVWGNVKSNTNTGSASVLTVDRWYNAATPGGAAATTPTAGYFMLADGGSVSAWFVGLSSNASLSPAHGDTSLSDEITTSGGGLIRKISPWALTSGTSPGSYTLTPVFTANGSDSLPVTVYGGGAFNSMVVSDATMTMMFETLLNASATFALSGDNATLTWSITES